MLRSGVLWNSYVLLRNSHKAIGSEWHLNQAGCVAMATTVARQPIQKWPEREVPPLENREFTADSLRTGVLAVKVGMTQDWDSYGAVLPLTMLWIDDCTVSARITEKCWLSRVSARSGAVQGRIIIKRRLVYQQGDGSSGGVRSYL